MAVNFSRSSKNRETLVYKSFEFWKHKDYKNGSTAWRCTKSVLFHCKARVTTRGGDIVAETNTLHTHEGNRATALARKAVAEMKDNMSHINSTPSSSQGAVAVNLPDHVLMALPKRPALNRALQRHRKKIFADVNGGTRLPPLPVDHNFPIPVLFEEMVLFDSGTGCSRIIIMGCDALLDGLGRADIWLADGTFSIVPTVLFQLYSIHFQFVDGMNPAAVYCLMSNKTADSYTRMLAALHDLVPLAAPKKILVDFEKAAMNAFEAAYPNAAVTGCYFHLTQSVIRKVNEIGMKLAYENDDAIRGSVRCLSALAFVPTTDVVEAFELLAESFPDHDHSAELLSFFEHTYIRGRRLRGRVEAYGQPLYRMELWNQHDAGAAGIARTTNSVEGWHHGLQSLFHCHHPNMWTFMNGIRQDMTKQKALVLQGATGITHPSQKKYRILKDRVRCAVESYGRTEILLFLHAIAHLSHT